MDVRVTTSQKPQRRASYRDVLAAPPHMVAEVLAGTLHTQPRPAMRHARASSILGSDLINAFDRGLGGPGGWWIVHEPELHLGEDILVPDLAGWRHGTMLEFPDSAYCTVAPDWACEVLSPSTQRIDRHEKSGIYAREGVSHLWLVDPIARILEAFELHEGLWTLLATIADDMPVSLPPFGAVTFPLGLLWPKSAKEDGNTPQTAEGVDRGTDSL